MVKRRKRGAIPQGITLTGIFFGLLSILWAEHQPYWACVAIVGAAFCDLVDGRVARFTGTSSEFGAELDSLADIVSFGLAPAILVYRFGLQSVGASAGFDPWVFVSFLFVACGAIRLAIFNISTTGEASSKDFRGVPIPVAALLLATLVMSSVELGWSGPRDKLLMAPFVIVVALLMVAPIRLRSFKQFRRSWGKYIFFGAIAGGFLYLGLGGAAGTALLGVLVVYVVIGIVQTLLGSGRVEVDAPETEIG